MGLKIALFLFIAAAAFASENFIIFAVDARKLDYSSASKLIRTIAKHPSDGSKNSDVGHAWIYLKQGSHMLQGGHSAERGIIQPRYLEGVCLLAEEGDPNPARYLLAEQSDGYFEIGDGGHRPTFAARIDLSADEAEKVRAFIEAYPFERYALSEKSCATFVAEVAALVGLELDYRQKIKLPRQLQGLPLWSDPVYSEITIASPDRLEQSLRELVHSGRAADATAWLIRQRSEPHLSRLKRSFGDLLLLPYRTWRWLQWVQ